MLPFGSIVSQPSPINRRFCLNSILFVFCCFLVFCFIFASVLFCFVLSLSLIMYVGVLLFLIYFVIDLHMCIIYEYALTVCTLVLFILICSFV